MHGLLTSLPSCTSVRPQSSWMCNRVLAHTCKHRQQRSRHSTLVQANLDHDTSLAVVQQSISFITFILGEAYVSRRTLPKDRPGRPGVVPIVAGCIGYAGACALLQLGDATTKAGLITGWVNSLVLIGYYFKRALDTKGKESDWPGPKVWPGAQALISFFCLNIYFQAFLKS